MTQRPEPEDAAAVEPGAARPGEGDDPWSGWVRHLVEALRALPDGRSVTATAPDTSSRPVRLRTAHLGGLVPARHRVVVPWVRLTRSDDHLRGSCIGSEAVGGHFPLAPEEHAALTALGWRQAPPLEGEDYTHWWPDDVAAGPFLPEDDARSAALMVAATFRTVLAPTPADDPSPRLPDVTTD